MTRLALLPTCVLEALAPEVGMAAVRLLRAAGYDPFVPEDVTCCGQPAWNAGQVEEAAAVARTTLEALAAGDDPVCVPAGSCTTMIRVYWPQLFELAHDEEAVATARSLAGRVRELTELLSAGPATEPPPDATPVAYHHSCHMLRELGLREEPLALLRRSGYRDVPWDGDDRCCGFGGTFSLKQPDIAVAMADEKLDALADSGAEALVGADLSCLLHLEGRLRRRGIELPVRHVAELADPELHR